MKMHHFPIMIEIDEDGYLFEKASLIKMLGKRKIKGDYS
jgi:hypothetical protein